MYGKNLQLRNYVIFGGVNQNPQVDAIRRGIDVLVATPGRLLDLMNQGFIQLNQLEIFVLDEATSSVDSETESMIQKAIETLTKHRTSIIIAHRLATVQHVDNILVLEHGEIVESGNHQTLINQKGKYADLYERQFLIADWSEFWL